MLWSLICWTRFLNWQVTGCVCKIHQELSKLEHHFLMTGYHECFWESVFCKKNLCPLKKKSHFVCVCVCACMQTELLFQLFLWISSEPWCCREFWIILLFPSKGVQQQTLLQLYNFILLSVCYWAVQYVFCHGQKGVKGGFPCWKAYLNFFWWVAMMKVAELCQCHFTVACQC